MEASNVEKTFKICEANFKSLTEKFKHIEKRAQRVNAVPPTLKLVKWEDETVKGITTKYAIVKVSGSNPHIEGYLLVGVLNAIEGSNVIRTVPHTDLPDLKLFERFGDAPPVCEYCHAPRQRNDTFLLYEQSTRDIHQIGRSCLQYFFEKESPEQIAQWFELVFDAVKAAEDAQFNDRFTTDFGCYDVELVMELTACIAKKSGFVSVRQAGEWGKDSTSGLVCLAFHDIQQGNAAGDVILASIKASDKLTAQTILNWARHELTPTTDYTWNVHNLLSKKTVAGNNLAFVVSAYAAYFRYLERTQETKAKEEYNRQFTGSEYIGEVGKMTNLSSLKVLFTKEINSEDYGVSYLYKLIDNAGNVITTFSRSESFKPEVSQTVHIRCKVKKHEAYQGIKQTVVSHAKLISEDYARTGKKTNTDKTGSVGTTIVESDYDEKLGF